MFSRHGAPLGRLMCVLCMESRSLGTASLQLFASVCSLHHIASIYCILSDHQTVSAGGTLTSFCLHSCSETFDSDTKSSTFPKER